MYYSEELIEEVRSRNDIVDVISGYVRLQKKGSSYFGLCPFHNEKSPSFSVSRQKQMYYCFGCGAGGNVFTFLMEYENFSIVEAVKFLADRAGIELPEMEYSKEAKEKADLKSTILEMNKLAAKYFYVQLKSERGSQAYSYLKNRELSDETITAFGLGFSNKYSDDLYKYLREKGYSEDLIRQAGLINTDERQGAYDKFWNRVMFPIMDVNNRVIGFGGRVMGDGKPKYLNSPETLIFDKSRNLFAMNIARRSRRKGFICCEGYMDVISMHQAGFDNAVASLGTAFTFGHANILKRYTNEVYLAYDSDGAGVAATLKVISIMREVGISARVINMRPYKDPDEFIQTLGSEAFEERIQKAESAIMFEVRMLSEQYNLNDPEERTSFHNETAKRLAQIEEVLERNNYIEAVSNLYHIDKTGLTDLVHKYGIAGVPRSENVEREERRAEHDSRAADPAKNKPMKLLLTWMVNEPGLFQKLDGIIDETSFEDGVYRVVADKLFSQYRENGKVEPASIVTTFESIEEQRLVAEMLQTNIGIDMTQEEINNAVTDVVKKIRLSSIEDKLAKTNDIKEMQNLIRAKADLTKLHISL